MLRQHEWLRKTYKGWVVLKEGNFFHNNRHDLIQLIEECEKKGFSPMGTDIVYVD